MSSFSGAAPVDCMDLQGKRLNLTVAPNFHSTSPTKLLHFRGCEVLYPPEMYAKSNDSLIKNFTEKGAFHVNPTTLTFFRRYPPICTPFRRYTNLPRRVTFRYI